MEKVSFKVSNFQPSGGDIPSGNLIVRGCSNGKLDEVQGKKGVVVFLHGSGGKADDYANMYPTSVYLPDDFNIIFLQSPRSTGSHWMQLYEGDTLDHHWVNSQVEDNMVFLSEVLDQIAEAYGGHERVWIAGFSQGAVMSAAMVLRGTKKLLGGAFVIAGYPARPLYTDDSGSKFPTDWHMADVAIKTQTKVFFYTGELDTVLPIDKSFCRFNSVVNTWGLDSANYRFWSKTGYCHYDGDAGGACHNQISPHGNEFHALWHVVKGELDQVAGVELVKPGSDCK
jgi:predicted esterase